MSAGARQIFGCGVWSDVPLRPLEHLPAARSVDVRIWLASHPPWLAAVDRPGGHEWYISPHVDAAGRPLVTAAFLADGRVLRLRYREGTEFFLDVRHGEIAARWPDTVTLDDITSYLLGPVLGLFLRYQGTTCLHASAVVLHDRAIAFVGVEGAGKSTIAGAFAVRGAPVLSDDVVPLEEARAGVLAHPGWARVRLWPPSAQAIATMDPRRTWHGDVSGERRYNLDLLPHGYRFQTEPLPIGVIYLLRTDARPTSVLGFETVHAQDALISLVANTFAARLVRSADRAKEFEVLAKLIAAVPVRRLHNGGSLDRLPDLCAAIQSDVSQFVLRRVWPAH